ncbi:metacaspase [Angomonas deanei]|uniref:Caspase domain containing protein, putative n=1 Tax=Angomonas deanei TaxID=59799 RepID=A0A7G2CL88_9TRYP|nr:metacaspase [Angomonas deanei]CAD2220620.1 Caspase domain containing protein, putative [Angomonas deanei]|eukprot:EPY40512.1 metacaspase [Angomonas deanei]
MGFDKECIKNAFGVGKKDVTRALKGEVDWVTLGKKYLELARPYVVKYIGEVPRPSKIDLKKAFQDAKTAKWFKPYEVPKEKLNKKGTVRALLIGINYYGTSAELSGCVNDVKQELATFQKTAFPVEEMAILVDDKEFPNVTDLPTRANIIKYMAWLVKDVKEGDVLFLHYSGHGAQTKSKGKDVHEEYDQVICPMDYTTAGTIVDDDLFAMMCKDLPKGVRLTTVFDCCHSGSMLDVCYQFTGNHNLSAGSVAHMNQVRTDNYSKGDVLLISGCADSQTSSDVKNTATLGNGTSGAGGAATQCLTYTLLNTTNLTYIETLVKTREMLAKRGFSQVPQLSCSKPLNLMSKMTMSALFELDEELKSTLPKEYL